jgi:hypothetical protein
MSFLSIINLGMIVIEPIAIKFQYFKQLTDLLYKNVYFLRGEKKRMLQIRAYEDTINYRKLQHSENVFHDAISGVLKGEINFQVINPGGEDYCLHYTSNIDWAKQFELYPKSKHLDNYPFYPPYLKYDENDIRKLSFDIFEGINRVWFQEMNEYTVVVAKLLLKHTDVKITFADERIGLFIPESERLSVIKDEPDHNDMSLLRVINSFYPAPVFHDNNQIDQIHCFHCVFFFQWLSDLPIDKIRYAEIVVPKSEGIGSILSVYARMKKFFDRYNIETTIQPGSSRYSDSMLRKYFDLCITPKDANSDNTICIVNFFSAWVSRFVGTGCFAEYDVDSLNPDFRAQMEEYAQAVIGNKRMLAVLLRGSDYFISDMNALSKPVKVEVAIPFIEKWMEEDGYDGIVLATEDEDMLEGMRKAFGNKLIAIAQERYKVKQFEKSETIAELEHEIIDEKEYSIHLEDTTVNYFYAIYLLSKCESFIYSNICGGERIAHIFNNGKYLKDLCIQQVLMNNEQNS